MLYIILIVTVFSLLIFALPKKIKSEVNGQNFEFNLSDFSNELGFMESSNNYLAKNSIGALGKYQFMPTTLTYLQDKYKLEKWIDDQNFLSKPTLQEKYFEVHVQDVLNATQDLSFYIGAHVSGKLRFPEITTTVNYYGIVAGAHLGGVGGVRNYLKGIRDANDGHTAVSDYVAYFSNKLA